MEQKSLVQKLKSKPWKLLDMLGVRVPAKLLNFFHNVFFFSPAAVQRCSFFFYSTCQNLFSLSTALIFTLKGSLSPDWVFFFFFASVCDQCSCSVGCGCSPPSSWTVISLLFCLLCAPDKEQACQEFATAATTFL